MFAKNPGGALSRGVVFGAMAAAMAALIGAQESAAQNRRARANAEYPPKLEGARVETYKTIGDVKLSMYIFEPEGHKSSDRRAAVVFFFGGGWTSGTPAQFHHHCQHLASRGMIAMAADYRVASRHQTKAIACVEDGKSAVRWIRSNAERLGIDADRIAAGGGSAGGHVAACTGVVPGIENSAEDANISSRPNAMVLFNPALIIAPYDGLRPLASERLRSIQERIGDEPKKISPIHHVAANAPPTLILHGKADETVAYKTAELFTQAMSDAGNRCELVGYEGQPHGFFNYGRGDGSHYKATLAEMDKFLTSLKYLEPQP